VVDEVGLLGLDVGRGAGGCLGAPVAGSFVDAADVGADVGDDAGAVAFQDGAGDGGDPGGAGGFRGVEFVGGPPPGRPRGEVPDVQALFRAAPLRTDARGSPVTYAVSVVDCPWMTS
jgi:hypothetical protein